MEFPNLPAGSSPRPSYEGWVTAALAPNLLQNTSKPGERNTSETEYGTDRNPQNYPIHWTQGTQHVPSIHKDSWSTRVSKVKA